MEPLGYFLENIVFFVVFASKRILRRKKPLGAPAWSQNQKREILVNTFTQI